MDILTHTCSGLLAASALQPFSNVRKWKIIPFLCLGAFGGAFPDVDAISLWSRFDSTFGNWFGLEHTGKEIYFNKFWYSHHGFFHSVSGLLFVVLFVSLLIAFFFRIFRRKTYKELVAFAIWPLVFLTGALFHVFEDMLTPGSVWGGVRMFWPFEAYFGGAGSIWWWNNYDLFLILLAVIIINLSLMFFSGTKTKASKILPLLIIIIGLFIGNRQISNRQVDYNYTGFSANYYHLEQKSLEEQQRILGKRLFKIMYDLDSRIPIFF